MSKNIKELPKNLLPKLTKYGLLYPEVYSNRVYCTGSKMYYRKNYNTA